MIVSSNKIIKNYIYNTSYQLFNLLIPMITIPYVSRILGADGVGIYSYVESIATYFVLFGTLGTNIYGQREVAYVQSNLERRTIVFWEIQIIRGITSILSAIVYYVFVVHNSSPDVKSIYEILLLQILATGLDISWFFMGIENFKTITIRNLIIRVAGVILIFVLVKKPSDIALYACCIGIPTLLGNLSMWPLLPRYLNKTIKKAPSQNVFRHLKPTLILYIPQVATEIYMVLDKTMLGYFSSSIDEVGYYTQASKIVKIILTLVTSLGTVMLPAMSFAFSEGKIEDIKNSIQKAFRFVFFLDFGLLFGLLGISSNFVPIFFGAGYDKVVLLIWIISPVLVFISISNVIGKQYLLPTKQQRAYTISVIGGAATNFILNLILINWIDSIGASIATVIAEFTVMFIQIVYARKQINLNSCLRSSIRYIISGTLMFVVVYQCGKFFENNVWTICMQIIVGITMYCALLVLSKDPLLREGKKVLHVFSRQ